MKLTIPILIALLALGAGCIAWQSCTICSCKKVSCPAYNNAHFDLWFPYQAAQQIILQDSTHTLHPDTITIANVSATASYEANKGCVGGSASGCSSNKYISGNTFTADYAGASDWDGNATDSNYYFTVHEFTTQAKGIGDTGFVQSELPSRFYDNIVLNGNMYRQVQLIYKPDTTGVKDLIYQVYIQKGTGLLAYRYYPSQALFVKQ